MGEPHQLSLRNFYDGGERREETGSPPGTHKRKFPSLVTPPATFSCLEEAKNAALRHIQSLPVGETFTVRGLFGGWRVRGRDIRVRGALLLEARRLGLVGCVGYTNEDQAGRNNGVAHLWVRRGES